MSMTPEERAEYERQSKINLAMNKEKEKKTNVGCLSVIIVMAFSFIVFGMFHPNSNNSGNSSSESIDIHASVSFSGTQLIISNNDDFDWENTSISINPGVISGGSMFDLGYLLDPGVIKARDTYTVGIMNFAKRDGTRLNPFQTKPQSIIINCNTSTGKNGSFGGKFQ